MSQKFTVFISGMHCRSCELLLEEAIGAVPGVGHVGVNHKKGEALIEYEGVVPSEALIEQAVRTAGYEVGVGKSDQGDTKGLSTQA